MKLWRGDNDSGNVRQLKMTVERAAGLLSNMTSGGNPLALAQQGFLASIQNHISPGWSHTHFLSFSKSKTVAEGFAIGHSRKSLQLSNEQKWDTAIVEVDLNLNSLSFVSNYSVGMDHYSFMELGLQQSLIPLSLEWVLGRQLMFQGRSPATRNILVVDVHQHLSHLQSQGMQVNPQVLANAQQNQEVLILPLDPLPGVVGLTGLLDFGCATKIELYELV